MTRNKQFKILGGLILLIIAVILTACSAGPDPAVQRAQVGTQIALTQIAYGYSPPDWTPTPQPTATPLPTPTPTATPLGGNFGQWMRYDDSSNKLIPMPVGVEPVNCNDWWGCPGDVYYFYQNGVRMDERGTPWWWPWLIILSVTVAVGGVAWFFLHRRFSKFLEQEFRSAQPDYAGGQPLLPTNNQPLLGDGTSDIPTFMQHIRDHDEVFAAQLMVNLEKWETEDAAKTDEGTRKDRIRKLFKGGDQ